MACTQDALDIRVDKPAIGLVVVKVAGEIDILGAPALQQRVDERLPEACAFVLDLSGATFFGAAGLSVLVHTSVLAERLHVNWALVCPSSVSRLLRITELDRDLLVCSEFSEAIVAATAVAPALS
ncbi:STAS domain-containing protein [Saccharomonospora sp.]|uniref:STAS domain-containing protein n=1 Tax=Saccharomonospora sp. TaxID=33913 RepID=UPI002604A78D|nr:STAS domain-containing protein [Saccharomonospora sp.]